MTEPTSASERLATARPTRLTRRQAKPGAGKRTSRIETKGEALLHELVRRMGFDARADKHASDLVTELGKLLGCITLLGVVAWTVRIALATHFVACGVSFLVNGHWPPSGGYAMAGIALDMTGFTVTAPGAGGAAMTAVTGDPTSVRNASPGTGIRLVSAWTKAQGTGFTQIVYPSGHDTTRNIRYENVANQPGNMLPRGIGTPMKSQDLLTLTQAGSAVAGDVELACLMMKYDDLPGIAASLITLDDLQKRIIRLVTLQGTLTATVASQWSGSTAISALTQFLHGNTDYAWLGAKFSAVGGAIALRGPATGNLRVGIPGLTSPDVETVNWFPQLAEWYGEAMIPTFNSADNSGTFLELLQDENLTAVVFSLMLAELAAA